MLIRQIYKTTKARCCQAPLHSEVYGEDEATRFNKDQRLLLLFLVLLLLKLLPLLRLLLLLLPLLLMLLMLLMLCVC